MSYEEVLPPQNLEAEQCVLGSMLLDREVIGDVVLHLEAHDFYLPGHAEIFRVLVGLWEAQQPVDLVLATHELKGRDKLAAVGGVEALVSLMECVPSAGHAEAYARLVHSAAQRRRLVEAARDILKESHKQQHGPVDELVGWAEQRILDVAQERPSEGALDIRTLIKQALQRIDQAQEDGGRGATRGLPTHYGELDRKLNGLAPGSLYVIAGRPSMGKTSFAMSVLENLCVRDKVPALLFTLEVTKEQVAENMLCGCARVDAHKLMRGELSNEEYAKVPQAAARLSQAPLFVDDSPGLTLARLASKARRMVKLHQVALVVVDYLQLLQLGTSVESRQIEISRLSGALKQLARDLSVPVIALSQLNRAVESRQDKRPLMGDLRESGSIEQDADAVLLLYRDEYYNPERVESRGKAEVILAKNRNGPTGRVDLFFFPSQMRFENPMTYIPDDAPVARGATAV